MLLLEQQKTLLQLPQKAPLHVIVPLAYEQDSLGVILAHHLRENGFTCDIIFEKASTTNMLKKVNRMNPSTALIIGEQEQTTGVISVKNMRSGESALVKQHELVNYLKTSL
jgi:histidyl-tRNA synthetase